MAVGPLDKSNPKSLYNLVPREVRKILDNLEDRDFGLTEDDYEREYGFKVDSFTNRVRMEFWKEMDSALNSMRGINLDNVAFRCGCMVSNVMKVLSVKESLKWVLIPPGNYESYLDEALQFGLMRLRKDILGAPLYQDVYAPDGTNLGPRFDSKAADLLLKTVAFLDMRKNGAIVNKNLHIVKREGELKDVMNPDKSLEEIEKRIRELEGKGVVDKATKMVEGPEVMKCGPNLTRTGGVKVPTVKDFLLGKEEV